MNSAIVTFLSTAPFHFLSLRCAYSIFEGGRSEVRCSSQELGIDGNIPSARAPVGNIPAARNIPHKSGSWVELGVFPSQPSLNE